MPYDGVMGITILIIEGNSMLQEHLVRYLKTDDWRIFNSRQQKDIKQIFSRYGVGGGVNVQRKGAQVIVSG